GTHAGLPAKTDEDTGAIATALTRPTGALVCGASAVATRPFTAICAATPAAAAIFARSASLTTARPLITACHDGGVRDLLIVRGAIIVRVIGKLRSRRGD